MSQIQNEEPLVSVVTPAYNAGAYIKNTIESVLRQTYQNFELLIANYGSTDNTDKVVRAFSDPRIKYLYQDKNNGQSASRNAALAVARGKYIAFLDADDLFYPGKLAEQVSYMEAHPECDFCYCKIYHFFTEDPKTLYHLEMEHPSGRIFERLLVNNFINPLSAMVRKEVFTKYGVFESKFWWADEQYLWLKLSYNKVNFCYLDKVLGQCRLHPNSFTNQPPYFKESQKQCLDILKLMRGWMSEAEIQRYGLEGLEKKIRMRIMLGRLMSGKNPFARILHSLYLLNRKRRLKKILV